jgi:hypothetical protein
MARWRSRYGISLAVRSYSAMLGDVALMLLLLVATSRSLGGHDFCRKRRSRLGISGLAYTGGVWRWRKKCSINSKQQEVQYVDNA